MKKDIIPKTKAPIGALDCNFQPFNHDIQTDTVRGTVGVMGKSHFQCKPVNSDDRKLGAARELAAPPDGHLVGQATLNLVPRPVLQSRLSGPDIFTQTNQYVYLVYL